jgi:hypothetical protein
MDYKKHYELLVIRAKFRNISEYAESHHIIPRCLGGDDSSDNLVDLTPEEHYLAHQLLVKMYPDNKKLIHAAMMMIPKRPSNKLYGWLRRKFSAMRSEDQKNINLGSRWIHNKDLKKNKKIKKIESLPEGWKEGRIQNFELYNVKCKTCGSTFERKKLEIYCSDICKKNDKNGNIKKIDENLEDMIIYYQNIKSIDKTLKHFGLVGVRAGNGYFSRILKERNIPVRKRRNSI